jgi:hypothetical protein
MKNIKKMTTMKTIYILTAILGLQFSTLFAAGNDSDLPASLNNEAFNIPVAAFAPVTPAEATFEEIADDSVLNLSPVTPKEADFEDETVNGEMTSLMYLTPVTPADADFEDYI